MARSRDLGIDKTIGDVISSIRKPKLEPETGWAKVGIIDDVTKPNVPFESGWGNAGVIAGVTNAPASWYLSEDGEVRLRGKITGGAEGTSAFTLPEEVRPEYAETFICAVDGGGKANVTIYLDGTVLVETING